MYAFMSVVVLVWLSGNEEDIIWFVLWYVPTYLPTYLEYLPATLSLSLGVKLCIR